MIKTAKTVLASMAALALAVSPAAAAEAAQTTGGRPWPDTDLKINLPETAEGLSPKDDFHLYNNYEWLMAAELEEGSSSASRFTDQDNDVREKVFALLRSDGAGSHETELVRQFYRAYTDWDARNAAGVEPLDPCIGKITAASSLADITDLYTDPELYDLIVSPVPFGNTVDILDSTRYIFTISEISFLLDDPAEYTARTDMGERKYRALKVFLETMLPRFGIDAAEAEDILDGAMAYESILAESAYTMEEKQSPDYVGKILNLMSYEELLDQTNVFPTGEVVRSTGYEGMESVMLMNPDFYHTVDESYTEENVEIMKDWLITWMIMLYAPHLDRDALNAHQDYLNAVNGSEGYIPDEDQAYDAVLTQLPFQLSKAYVDYYDLEETRERIVGLCGIIRDEYREMMQTEEWLSEETRQKAIEKLDAMKLNAVYPEKWEDYSSLQFSGNSFFDVIRTVNRDALKRDSDCVNGEVEKGLWNRPVTKANAYYDLQENSINILGGILGGVFYREDMSEEELYGSIGMVIAHEITHAFDPSGSQYDKDGNWTVWWTQEDMTAYEEKAAKLIAFYDKIEPRAGLFCSGAALQGEVVADLGAVRCMLNIIEKKGLDQKVFFESYARIWARCLTAEMEESRVRFDVHPLGYLRTNAVLQQFQEFCDVYDVQEGDGMYLAPEDRIAVW